MLVGPAIWGWVRNVGQVCLVALKTSLSGCSSLLHGKMGFVKLRALVIICMMTFSVHLLVHLRYVYQILFRLRDALKVCIVSMCQILHQMTPIPLIVVVVVVVLRLHLVRVTLLDHGSRVTWNLIIWGVIFIVNIVMLVFLFLIFFLISAQSFMLNILILIVLFVTGFILIYFLYILLEFL